MNLPLATLLTTDIVLAVVGVVLRQRMEGRVQKGITTGFVVVFAAVVVHFIGAIPLALSLSKNMMSQAVFIRINMLLGFVPTIVYCRFFLEAVSSGGADALFGLNTGLAVECDFSKAKALERGGDIAGAIDQYRRYFREQPENPQALFAIGQLQSKEELHSDAADTYRQIVGKFREEDEVWARASFQLAEILVNNLHDKSAGQHLMRQILKRTPKTKSAGFARSRLMPTDEDAVDQFYREG
jgi:TolA-binding protein